jgi:ATP-dependent DNA helicase DinG
MPLKGDRIIEVGIVVIESDQITDSYSTLINPEKPIPPFITNLTGIADNEVKDAPLFHEEANEIINIFRNSYLVAHNVPFDLGFLNAELTNHDKQPLDNPVLDTVELARILYPKAPSFKLSQLAAYLEIQHDDPHRALSDAFVTAKLLLKLKEKLRTLPYETIFHLRNMEKLFKSDLYQLLMEQENALAFSTNVNKDIDVYKGLAFKHIDDEETVNSPFDTSFGDFLDQIYEVGGTMQQFMDQYEKREGQREMSESIFDAFQLHHHTLIEAETGTGKSLAYLIPAIYEAVKTKKRIIVSTYTTQLQSQLLEEEIPLIQKLVDIPFSTTLLKGKNHYVSLEKFERELDSSDHDNYDITLTKAMILVWLTETETGDIDEIQLPPSGYFFYRKISTDSEGDLNTHSPWFSKSFYQKARKKAQQAHLVITNHALLCTDMFNDYQLLPRYDNVIIDEAHHLEETASRHYGMKIDYKNMQFTLNQIGSTDEAKSLGNLIKAYDLATEQLPLEKWDEIFSQAKYEIDDLFRFLFQYVVKQQKNNKSLSDIGRTQYRFDPETENNDQWKVILEMVTRLTFYLRDLIHVLALIEQHLDEKEVLNKYDKNDLKRNAHLLQSFINGLEQLFLITDTVQQVKWIETDMHGSGNAVYLYSEPTNISSLLATEFFAKKDSVILTSATLTMKNSFTFIQERLGVPTERLITEKITSPFSYKDQVQLMVPSDFPDIKYGNQDDNIFATCEAILSLAEITKGRMLVLFTSYDMLRKSHALLKEIMDTDKYMLIGQGISSGSRSRLKKNFQTFDQAILLGTSSFWEGVDIPGEDLSCLVIVRLPFQPPDHPIYEAKAQHLKSEGKNAFIDLSLPNAVIKFKQGFGRLIRSTSDRGIVFVCDSRIVKARYGKFFTESIPSVPLTYATTQELMDKAEEWF